MAINKKYIGYLQMIAAQAGVGLGVVVSKTLMKENVSIFMQIESRFVFCTVFLLVNLFLMFLYSPKKAKEEVHLKLNRTQWFLVFLQSLFAGVLFNLIMLAGLRFTTATMAGILTSTLPAILAILSFLLLKERIGNQRTFAIFLAIVGVIILHLDTIGQGTSKNALLGGSLVILSMVPEALYTILAKKLGPVVHPLMQAIIINLFSCLVFLPVWLYFGGWDNISKISGEVFMKFAWIGFFSYLFYYLWTAGVNKVAASVAAVFTGVMPIATTVGAILFMGEHFTLYDAAGMFFVLSSITIGSGIKEFKCFGRS